MLDYIVQMIELLGLYLSYQSSSEDKGFFLKVHHIVDT